MYSLLVNHRADEQSEGSFDMERPRFLEYIANTISGPLCGLSKEAIDCLCSWPCILMQEGRTGEIARLVEVTGVKTAREAQAGGDDER